MLTLTPSDLLKVCQSVLFLVMTLFSELSFFLVPVFFPTYPSTVKKVVIFGRKRTNGTM